MSNFILKKPVPSIGVSLLAPTKYKREKKRSTIGNKTIKQKIIKIFDQFRK